MKTQSRGSTERIIYRPATDEEDAPAAQTGTLPVRTTHPREAAATAGAAPPIETPAVAEGQAPAERTSISWLTLENGLYLLFFVLALATRFVDLDFKGLHHDESLHAVFSWRYYMDQGYIHSPMMHGPEQFHFIDLFFLLFGATDATARFASATCGVFLVMAPWFLRRQLGRWPALIASFLFLISPGFMYFTRFAREDAIYAGMEMIFVLGLWRFVDERKPRDFYVMCAGYSLMFTIKESAYLTTAIVGLLLVGLFAWQMGRWLFSTFLAYLAVMGAVALVVMRIAPKLPNIPAQDPTPENIQSFVSGLIGHPLVQSVAGITLLWLVVWGYLLWDQSRRVSQAALAEVVLPDESYQGVIPDGNYQSVYDATEPVVTNGHSNGHGNVVEDDVDGVPTTVLAAEDSPNGNGEAEAPDVAAPVAAAVPSGIYEAGEDEGESTLDGEDTFEVEGEGEPAPVPVAVAAPPAVRQRRVARMTTMRMPNLFERYQPGSIPYAVGYLVRNPAVFGTGLAIAVMLFVALYTSLFTNINGIGTGLFGSIGYWLAQQDVRRGDQPWFYYFILLPIYEPVLIFFSLVGILYFAWQGVRSLFANQRTAAVLYALGIIFFPIGIPVAIIAALVRSFRNARYEEPVVAGASRGFNVGKPVEFADFRPFLVLFLGAWFLGAIGLYSWAGEKMPWLSIHILQPMVFLAALALGQLAKSMIRHRRARAALYVAPMDDYDRPVRRNGGARGGASRGAAVEWGQPTSPWATLVGPTSWVPFLSFISAFIVIAVFWSMSITHRVMNNDYDNWWQLLIWPALLLLLAAGYWSLVGGARVLRYAMVGVLALLSVYAVRSAVQLSFYNAMDAREMYVYVQTDPDVTRAADAIDRLSVDQTGTRDLKVVYDSLASWPWEWYLRDYKNKQFLTCGPTSAPDPSVAVMVVDSAWYDKVTSGQAPQLDNYLGVKYPMRWWFPEDTYRNFVPETWNDLDPAQPTKPDGTPNYKVDAEGKQVKGPVRQIEGALDTILYTLRTPSEQGKVWKYLIYRQPFSALGSTDFAVFVRKDLVQRYNYLQTLDLPDYDSSLSH
jgi:predicted membrane-bound mannosyltransferase